MEITKKFDKGIVRNGDFYNESAIAELVGNVKASIYYSDPPWGDGNIKYWNTMNKKMNAGKVVEDVECFSYIDFLDKVLTYATRYTDGWVVIEYGKRWNDKLIEMAKKKSLHYCGTVETLYSGKLPLDVNFFRTDKVMPVPNTEDIYHTKDNRTVQVIFDTLFEGQDMAGKWGMDLCCGLGLTAKACLSHNMNFVGNELNETRIQKTYNRFK